ncbi:hypothetical protein [Brachybacterium sacelli]|uniref:Peptidase inhibitor family I36 n=1 Tax=Brachybacterium sacelli TaxID=173364 RepID=A0ABS4WXA9_9MICO|nr:hypothetical protein [Brachybacterium sacelli]MBP2380837.1 hypothetical protein [Brachybacterium sacelli]
MARKRILRAGMCAVATAALSATAVGGMAASASATGTSDAEAKALHGCPSGAVCIYDDAAWEAKQPEHMYWSYGPHKLYDEYGTHALVNNQTGGATMTLCEGADGTNCIDPRPAPATEFPDLTRFNSVKLAA